MIDNDIAKNIVPFDKTETLKIKAFEPVTYKYIDESISENTHKGILKNTLTNINEVIPYTVGAIKDIYDILDEKYYDIPFCQDDFVQTRPTISSGKPIIDSLDKIMAVTPVIHNDKPNLITNQSIFETENKVDYVSLVIYLCGAVKELKQRIDLLTKK